MGKSEQQFSSHLLETVAELIFVICLADGMLTLIHQSPNANLLFFRLVVVRSNSSLFDRSDRSLFDRSDRSLFDSSCFSFGRFGERP